MSEPSASAFIPFDDGFTERGWINAVPGLYPRVELSWRPMLIEECITYRQTAEKLQGMKLREFVAGHLAAKVKAWDLKDQAGKPLDITSVNCLRLKERLFNRLFSIINGDEPPDGVLGRTDEDLANDCNDVLEAARTNKSVAEVREARQRKNS